MAEEKKVEENIKVLMAREIADDICDAVENDEERGRCKIILFRILTEGKGVEELLKFSEASRMIIEDKLWEELGLRVKLVRI